ncbi:MAG: VWA-like domain-containing protein, partial [Rhodocyclaceae bacterium]|nr:VWA-like domain-containing protein [Rhodocyclaceae bacterium]
MSEREPLHAEAAARLAAARAQLILDHPFLGALVMRLPLVAAGWCRTTATDARRLYYNPRWIASLSKRQAAFALAHEALHCALGHFARRGHRLKRRWDLACDFAINALLVEEGLTPPPEAHVLEVFRGMCVEEIYACLDDSHEESERLDEHLWEGESGSERTMSAHGVQWAESGERDHAQSGGEDKLSPSRGDMGGEAEMPQRPAPLSMRERETLRGQWQRHLAAAAQRAREAGKLSAALARLVEATLAAEVSWRALLAQFLSQNARDDYSWQRPSRRSTGASGTPLFPALASRAGDVVVALDVSGSIGEAEFAEFIGELNALKGALPLRLTLLACDMRLTAPPLVFEPWEAVALPEKWQGGGGTSFVPVFDWVAREGRRPDALVYFTDGEGEFPIHAPDYPVFWLIKGQAPIPWGRRV